LNELLGPTPRTLNDWLIFAECGHSRSIARIASLERGEPTVCAGAVDLQALFDKCATLHLLRRVAFGWLTTKVIASVPLYDKRLNVLRKVRLGCSRKSKQEKENIHVGPNA
jgi:predicted DCC family thiol-disulfide oxidoreductase YuxK